MKIYERLKELAQKTKSQWTETDRAYVAELADKKGVKLNKACPDCYVDAASQLYIIYKPKATKVTESEEPKSEYELNDGIDITLHSFRYGKLHVCQKNCTPANVKLWLAAGLPLQFFKSVPK